MTYKRAFTLAEMAIVMVVLSVLALACVGFVKNKKIKKPRKMAEYHGVVECYYGDDGVLRRWTIDNRNNKKGKEQIIKNGNYCEAKIPSAHFYNVIVVGAGGDGGRYNTSYVPSVSSQYVESPSESGSISTTDVSQATWDGLPSWLNPDIWEAHSPSLSYSIIGARGKGGAPYTKPHVEINKPGCNICNGIADSNCPDDCIKHEILCTGGQPGKAAQLTSSAMKLAWGQAFKCTNTGISGGLSVELPCSEDGTSAYATQSQSSEYPCANGSNGRNVDLSSINVPNGFTLSHANTAASSIGGCSAGLSSISYITKRIEYTVSGATASGTSGTVKNKMYEKIPGSTLKLTPAFDKTQKSKAEYLEETETSSGYKPLLEANSGPDGGVVPNFSFVLNNDAKSPGLPASVYPSKFEPNMEDISNIAFNHDLKSKIAELLYKPGQSGEGMYPMVYKTGNPIPLQGYLYTNTGLKKVADSESSANSSSEADYYCLFGDSSNPGYSTSSGKVYCKAQKGKPGAVIVVW